MRGKSFNGRRDLTSKHEFDLLTNRLNILRNSTKYTYNTFSSLTTERLWVCLRQIASNYEFDATLLGFIVARGDRIVFFNFHKFLYIVSENTRQS